MRLTKLEIYGFKSFAKRTEIIFPQNVTGIVGPNGSGKSNIGDAVRWVLGEQSAKTLRGSSMIDVIFNGTEKRKALNFCEVTLVFDNSDHELNVAYGEVSITRRVYRNGDSEYLINNAACRLKDIVDLFRDTGVGKEGYSIIGQGRIDEILSQRSEDRRAVFEEAAGISRFRFRKEEAESRLHKAEDNLARLQDILEELEIHLKPLEKQSATAKLYLQLNERLKELDIRLFSLKYDRQHQKEVQAQQMLLKLKDAVFEAEQLLKEATEERNHAEEQQDNIRKALSAAHEQLHQRNEELHQVHESVQDLQNRIQSSKENLTRLQGELESYQNRNRMIDATLSQAGSGIDEARDVLARAEADLSSKRSRHEEATDHLRDLTDKMEKHKETVIARMNRIQDVKTTQARYSAMQQQMQARMKELKEQKEADEQNTPDFLSKLENARIQRETEEKKLAELSAQLEDFEQSTHSMLQEILRLQKQLQEDLQSSRSTETRLRTLKELQDGYEGYQYAVRGALTYARKAGLKGVMGVVATILHVPKELETAFDMALGGAMQHIVTETEQDAKGLIEFLRQNHLGRATFLPLSTIRSRALNPKERLTLQLPGCLGVASELCTFDEKYRNVVESLLGRTVIVKDLDHGIQIMKAGNHSFQCVTQNGDVMHAGGSITGGSIQQKVQNLLGRQREILELEAQLKEKNAVTAANKARLEELERNRGLKKEQREKLQYAVHQQEIAVVRDTERQKTAQSDYEAQLRHISSFEEALLQLSESLEQIDEQLRLVEKQNTDAVISSDELNRQGAELSAALEEARRLNDSTQEILTDALLTRQNAEYELSRLSRDRKRLEDDQRECGKQLLRVQNEISTVQAGMEKAEKAHSAALDKEREQENHVKQAQENVDRQEAEQERCSEQIKSCQYHMDAAQQSLSKETDREHRQEMQLSRIQGELTQLSDRLWNTYQLSVNAALECLASYDRLSSAECNASFNEAEAETEAEDIRSRIREMGSVNVSAIDEYTQLCERFNTLTGQRNDLEKAREDLQTLITQLLKQMASVFSQQFTTLQGYFSETFARLFGGGSGDLLLADPSNPLTSGIEIIVQPPGKKRQILSLFSGGERALTAIAILFAMLKLKPTPFCILDEIEAALDDANITYFANYLREFSKDTQFVVITHRKGTMERCDSLYGVSMEEKGISSMVSVNLADYE